MPGKECDVSQCPYPQGCVLEDQLKDLGLENTSAVPPARRFQQLGCPKAEPIIYSSKQPSRNETQAIMEQVGFRPLWDNPRPSEEHAKRVLASHGEPPEFYERLTPDQLMAEANKRQELARQIPQGESRLPKTPPDVPLLQKGEFKHTKPGQDMLYYHPSKRRPRARGTPRPTTSREHPGSTHTASG